MKTITTTAIVALTAATIGLGTLAPVAAQQAPAPAQSQQQDGPRHDNHGPRRPGGDLFGFESGVEGVEIALVRLSHAIDMTDAQQPLFDAFKTAALAAAENFASATETLRPKPVEGQTAERPDPSQRLENGIAMQTARLAALEAVQPAATAFFDSLTAEQLAQLTPSRPDRSDWQGFGKDGPRGGPATNG